MSPTPSDARCAHPECGKPFWDAAHQYSDEHERLHTPGSLEWHAFVPPTRVDEAPEGEPRPNPYWLIERPHYEDVKLNAIWWIGPNGYDWTKRAHEARRFATSEAARQAMKDSGLSWATQVIVTEHRDMSDDWRTPEQPAVTGEPEEGGIPLVEEERIAHCKAHLRTCALCTAGQHCTVGNALDISNLPWLPDYRTQENDGIPQTASRASRPTVESDGSARGRVKVTQMGGDAKMCRKCGVEAVEVHERVTTRKGEGFYTDTPTITVPQRFMRCPKCADEWNLHEQALLFERELSVATFHAYRRITAEQATVLAAAQQRITELSTHDPVSRTLGATDSPREDGTDVDPMPPMVSDEDAVALRTRVWQIVNATKSVRDRAPLTSLLIDHEASRTALSTTRTALQRVRDAAQAYFAAKDAWLAAPVAYDSSAMNGDHPLYTACAALEEDLRALTSSETDQ